MPGSLAGVNFLYADDPLGMAHPRLGCFSSSEAADASSGSRNSKQKDADHAPNASELRFPADHTDPSFGSV